VRALFKPILKVAMLPLSLILMTYILAGILHAFLPTSNGVIVSGLALLRFVAIFWLIARLLNLAQNRVTAWANTHSHPILIIILPVIKSGLSLIIALAFIDVAISYLDLSPPYQEFLDKFINILMIGLVTWMGLQLINAVEKVLLRHYTDAASGTLQARKVFTQVHVLKRVVLIIIGIISFSAMLMVFDNVRELGTSLLASAGVATAIIGFAAQRTLAGLLAGIQIAITQTVRIDDAVIVEGEFGKIEEITLSYAVLKTWDLRRLIIPINHFIEKPFQNWTRNSTNLLCPVMIYADHSLPVEAVRKYFMQILQESTLWDKQVGALQVTDFKEGSIELRALASADDAAKAWDLRCEIRENLLNFIREKFPDGFPKMKADVKQLPQ
jgi:small-conductance mechanosensitive channel